MSIGRNTRKPVAAARATPRTMDNAKSDMGGELTTSRQRALEPGDLRQLAEPNLSSRAPRSPTRFAHSIELPSSLLTLFLLSTFEGGASWLGPFRIGRDFCKAS